MLVARAERGERDGKSKRWQPRSDNWGKKGTEEEGGVAGPEWVPLSSPAGRRECSRPYEASDAMQPGRLINARQRPLSLYDIPSPSYLSEKHATECARGDYV
jgi:hypothetical protein